MTMKTLLCGVLCLTLLCCGCIRNTPGPEDPVQGGPETTDPAGGNGGGAVSPEYDPLEEALSLYLDCTAEAAVDAVLDGSALVQTQIVLADRCNSPKIAVLSGVSSEEERTVLAQRLKDWDLATISAVRDRLANLEDLLKGFMDCSYAGVRETLAKDHGQVDEHFIENLVNQQISACYDSALGTALHPSQGMQSPVGLARKDRVTLLAKDRIMQELYNEIKKDKGGESPAGVPGRNPKGEVTASL